MFSAYIPFLHSALKKVQAGFGGLTVVFGRPESQSAGPHFQSQFGALIGWDWKQRDEPSGEVEGEQAEH